MIAETDIITTLIQSAVAPVFLLAGVAGLLNVLTGRLARVMDRLEKMNAHYTARRKIDEAYEEGEERAKRRSFLVKRLRNVNRAIFFCTVTGLMVALVILMIFASELFGFNTGTLISLMFVLGMLFLILSFVLFLREIYFTNLSIHIPSIEEE